jgi:hypothetical protein
MTAQKLRNSQIDNASLQSPTSPNDTHADTKQTPETIRDLNTGSNTKSDKK